MYESPMAMRLGKIKRNDPITTLIIERLSVPVQWL